MWKELSWVDVPGRVMGGMQASLESQSGAPPSTNSICGVTSREEL